MCGPFRPVRKSFLSKVRCLKLPHLIETIAWCKANWPVVIPTGDRIVMGYTLRMTLNTHVSGTDMVESGGIDYCFGDWVTDVCFTGSVTRFTSHVPFRDCLGARVVVDRMTPVAERSRWSLHLVLGVMFHPPFCAGSCPVASPFSILDIPLRRKDKQVITTLCEVSLFPLAAIGKGDVFRPKCH